MKTICVYCASSDNVDQVYLDGAYQMGKLLAQRGLDLVYGGGSTGLMGKVANGALENGGDVIGIIPEVLHDQELAHKSLTRMEVVPDIHIRKARMIELSDGFLVLPGGFGTMEEFFEVLTWSQIGIHDKPIGLLNMNGYYDSLIKFIEEINNKGFIYEDPKSLFVYSSDPEDMLQKLLD